MYTITLTSIPFSSLDSGSDFINQWVINSLELSVSAVTFFLVFVKVSPSPFTLTKRKQRMQYTVNVLKF